MTIHWVSGAVEHDRRLIWIDDAFSVDNLSEYIADWLQDDRYLTEMEVQAPHWISYIKPLQKLCSDLNMAFGLMTFHEAVRNGSKELLASGCYILCDIDNASTASDTPDGEAQWPAGIFGAKLVRHLGLPLERLRFFTRHPGVVTRLQTQLPDLAIAEYHVLSQQPASVAQWLQSSLLEPVRKVINVILLLQIADRGAHGTLHDALQDDTTEVSRLVDSWVGVKCDVESRKALFVDFDDIWAVEADVEGGRIWRNGGRAVKKDVLEATCGQLGFKVLAPDDGCSLPCEPAISFLAGISALVTELGRQPLSGPPSEVKVCVWRGEECSSNAVRIRLQLKKNDGKTMQAAMEHAEKIWTYLRATATPSTKRAVTQALNATVLVRLDAALVKECISAMQDEVARRAKERSDYSGEVLADVERNLRQRIDRVAEYLTKGPGFPIVGISFEPGAIYLTWFAAPRT